MTSRQEQYDYVCQLYDQLWESGDDLEEARNIYKLIQSSKDSAYWSETIAEQYFKDALSKCISLDEVNYFELNIERQTQLIQKYPRSSAYGYRGIWRAKAGHWEDAIKDYEIYFSMSNRRDCVDFTFIGRCHTSLGNYLTAIDCFYKLSILYMMSHDTFVYRYIDAYVTGAYEGANKQLSDILATIQLDIPDFPPGLFDIISGYIYMFGDR